MSEHPASSASSKVLPALFALVWACAIGAFIVSLIYKAPFESPRFVVGGAVPGTAISAVGTLAAGATLAFAVRLRKAVLWAAVLLVANAGYLVLFAVSLT
jgi:hypothetical protein